MKTAGRRHKGRRTHTTPEDAELARIPRSFVIKTGKVSRAVKELSRDLRQAYRPWTAVNLSEKRRATLKDYCDVSGVLSISHMVVVRQRHERVYASFLRTKGGEGPSCHFRVTNYSLIRDIFKSQSKPRSSESDYQTSPLIVTQGFESKSSSNEEDLDHEVLAVIKKRIFLEAFPSKLPEEPQEGKKAMNGVRRVILFAYNGGKMFEMRHFAILKSDSFKDQFDLKPKIKRSPYKNELKEEAVTVKKEDLDDHDKLDFLRKNLSLVELGPRLTMKLCNFQHKLAQKLTVEPEDDGDTPMSDAPSDDHDDDSHSDDSESDNEGESTANSEQGERSDSV